MVRRFFLLLLLGMIAFFTVKGEAMRLDPRAHFLLQNFEHIEDIDIKGYLVTEEQVAEVLADPKMEITQKTNEELYHKNLYLLVRAKNQWERIAFGTLYFDVQNYSKSIFVQIAEMPPMQQEYFDHVMYVGDIVDTANNELPELMYYWEDFYALLDSELQFTLEGSPYAENIKVEPYLVTREQLAEVFANPKMNILEKSSQELYEQETFLLIRCKNLGKSTAYGTLYIIFQGGGGSGPVEITKMVPMQEEYQDYVIYMGIRGFPSDDRLPEMKHFWRYLYTM